MPIEFKIVGEHLDDSAHLLVLGTDGAYYDYDPAHERLASTEPDGRWQLYPTLDEATEWARASESS